MHLLNCLLCQVRFYYIQQYIIMFIILVLDFWAQQCEASVSPHVKPKPISPKPDQPVPPPPLLALKPPQCVNLFWPCAPTNLPFPSPPSVPSVLSFPIPPSPTLPPLYSLTFPPLYLSLSICPFLSVCLTSVSFPRALWCLRIRCSRMSSWCSSSPPTLPSHTLQPTRCPTSASRRPSLSRVAGCLL